MGVFCQGAAQAPSEKSPYRGGGFTPASLCYEAVKRGDVAFPEEAFQHLPSTLFQTWSVLNVGICG